ncbi:acyltransferase domain-containing protein [Acetobacterium paludosum]|uniref:Malonyl CoA-acyl carrier protein transacylase n=1 Tax=Acetobacterium paludosum TaxID=52693 RepID=A0A923I4L2_9FIRM|nr:ACP S-malonyltransferase [Acetobacterium paludosum]MBC3889828.1 acyltransferase domain-containing protein [Acetobacterium paludosum]
MGKIAVLFPGQGSQFIGMGKSLYEQSPAAKKVFDQIESLRVGTLKQCFEGPLEELNKTCNTQPCIFAVELAALEALRAIGVAIQGLAGFSLGEVTGLVAADMLSLEDGLKFVKKRGQAMEQAAGKTDAAMVVVLRRNNTQVEALCSEFSQCYPVNYNCPGQLVVSLLKCDVAAFVKRVKDSGGRAIPLSLPGGFHSPFMTYATKILEKDIFELTFSKGFIPLYSNVDATPYPESPLAIRSNILYQINHPVQWEKTIRRMIDDGFTTFIECGPGTTLGGFIKKINPALAYYHCELIFKDYIEAKDAGKDWSFKC